MYSALNPNDKSANSGISNYDAQSSTTDKNIVSNKFQGSSGTAGIANPNTANAMPVSGQTTFGPFGRQTLKSSLYFIIFKTFLQSESSRCQHKFKYVENINTVIHYYNNHQYYYNDHHYYNNHPTTVLGF